MSARSFATAILLVATAAIGCGGAKQDASPPPKLDVPKLAATAPPSANGRDASESVRQHWPFDDGVRFAVYADVDAMMKMDLFRALSQVPDEKCIGEVLAKMREVAAGADDRGLLVVARFVDPLPEAPLRACVATATTDERSTLTIAPPLAFYGDRALVEAAARGGGGRWPSSLTIGQDQLVSWMVKSNDASAHGGVHASHERFRIDANADVPEELGQLLEQQLAGGKMLGPMAKALKVERRGRRLDILFELREPPIDQARDLGILAALATHGVRSYITRSKAAEAKNTLGQIAKDVVADWEREDPAKPRAKRKLVSYPPVPKTVPRGTMYDSTPKDWAPWKTLRFEMSSPQRFQYEIIAAKDGESAKIVARGDLDGDGKTSLFEVTVKVDRAKDMLVVAPTISETDPDE